MNMIFIAAIVKKSLKLKSSALDLLLHELLWRLGFVKTSIFNEISYVQIFYPIDTGISYI